MIINLLIIYSNDPLKTIHYDIQSTHCINFVNILFLINKLRDFIKEL